MFDPSIGSWISQDPEGFDAGDANLMRFVGNDPTNAIDPSGLRPPLPGDDDLPPPNTVRNTRPLPLPDPNSIPVPRVSPMDPALILGSIVWVKDYFPHIGAFGDDWKLMGPRNKNISSCWLLVYLVLSKGVPPEDKYWPLVGSVQENVIKMLESRGFSKMATPNTSFVKGKNKVILYFKPGGVLAHIAIQLDNGWWLHKLGTMGPVIMTRTPDQVCGPDYGTVGGVYVRP